MDSDSLFFWINRDDTVFQGADALRPLLERLSASPFPAPTVLGNRERGVKGYLDSTVLKALDKRKTLERVANPQAEFEVVVAQMPDRTAISVFARLSDAPPAAELRSLFLDVVRIVSPKYARISPLKAGRKLNDEVYVLQRRSFYTNGLYWLNFFGPEEEARQGGPKLAENPFACVERLPQGLLMEVGDGPLDILTPEGRQRLIDATKAMPPPRLPGS